MSAAPATPQTFDPAKFPRKLNLGCGFDHREGYLNMDMNAWHNPDLLGDIRKIGFLPEQYYEEILAQDVLEHLPRTDTLRTLAHWNRPLKMGGRILIRVPSVQGVADLLRREENQHPAKQEELIQCLFGTQAYTGDFHFTSFTDVLLRHYLEQAGFKTVSIDLMHEWLFDVVGEKVEHIDAPAVRDFAELKGIARDEDFVNACYREILQRDADEGGKGFYLTSLGNGMDRQNVIDIMIGSSEYAVIRRSNA
jgi:predicted SAM-dependent methyltransferase